MIPIGQTILSSDALEFLSQKFRDAGLLNIPFIKHYLY